jgi:3-deoxy-D-manno-octulosonate 8-phosphate phosphatase (KDO 8-P phosphatase)
MSAAQGAWQLALQLPAELLARAAGIKVIFLDADGVLTYAGLYFSEHGETLKRFNTLDGQGLNMLLRIGIAPVVITGRDSPALRNRLSSLGIEKAIFNCPDKRIAAEEVLAELSLDWAQAAAMGDDWPDLPMLVRAQLACAPANAHPEVCSRAHFVTTARGGDGAVRQVCDLLLAASGHYAELLAGYTAGRQSA